MRNGWVITKKKMEIMWKKVVMDYSKALSLSSMRLIRENHENPSLNRDSFQVLPTCKPFWHIVNCILSYVEGISLIISSGVQEYYVLNVGSWQGILLTHINSHILVIYLQSKNAQFLKKWPMA
jgi:hypothetical protein